MEEGGGRERIASFPFELTGLASLLNSFDRASNPWTLILGKHDWVREDILPCSLGCRATSNAEEEFDPLSSSGGRESEKTYSSVTLTTAGSVFCALNQLSGYEGLRLLKRPSSTVLLVRHELRVGGRCYKRWGRERVTQQLSSEPSPGEVVPRMLAA